MLGDSAKRLSDWLWSMKALRSRGHVDEAAHGTSHTVR